MKQLLLLTTIALLSGCAMNRAASDRMLDQRADYEDRQAPGIEVRGLKAGAYDPKRSPTVVTDIWIYPHEMPSRDYFLGGWIRTIVNEPQWTMDKKQGDAR